MTMIPELADAYTLFHAGQKSKAIEVLQAAAKARPDDVKSQLASLEALVSARSVGGIGGRCGDYASQVYYNLLNEALNE